MTGLLKLKDKKCINKWIGKRLKYSLLYKASRDGCSARAFHEKCDNKGPTVTVLYNIDKNVYGGFTSLHWDDSGSYKNDSKAFLFRLYQTNEWKPVQMKVEDGRNATYCKASHGPTFGGRTKMWLWNIHDLQTFKGKIEVKDKTFHLNGSTNFGTSYTMNGEDYNTIANQHLKVNDIEVYAVEALPEETWRSTPAWNTTFMNGLKEKIQRYKPKADLVPHARFLMIGLVQAGKSSCFNTVNSIFRGRITCQASAGLAVHSITTKYHKYQIRNESDEPLNFRLHDTKGLEGEPGDLNEHQIGYILDGNLPDGHQFVPSEPISSDTQGFVKCPNLSDKIHCVVFVVDGSTAPVMPDDVKENLNQMQIQIRQREIPQVVLLTKVDKICVETCEDLTQVFYSPLIEDTVNKVSAIMGLPRAQILPIQNYEKEDELKENINILTLWSWKQMLNFADDYMCSCRDQLEERNN